MKTFYSVLLVYGHRHSAGEWVFVFHVRVKKQGIKRWKQYARVYKSPEN